MRSENLECNLVQYYIRDMDGNRRHADLVANK
jgi:hypothetical protein